MDRTTLMIVIAFLLDTAAGDPQNPLHPVRIIGGGISLGVSGFERIQKKGNAFSFMLGAVLTAAIVLTTYFSAKCLLDILYASDYRLGFCAETLLCYFAISAKALKSESMKVCRALEAGDTDGARQQLSRIVGRDTDSLTEAGVIRAAVETVAENLSDGVIAPLMYTMIGGAPLGLAYKAVNTLDSMIGYRNGKYEYFGKPAARLDDAANLIPARVSAALMLLATPLVTGNTQRAAKTFIRDRYKHKSPNSAQTEAVCAGALGLRLGGGNYYNGLFVQKPEIGENIAAPEPRHIAEANRLMYAAVLLFIAAAVAISLLRRLANV